MKSVLAKIAMLCVLLLAGTFMMKGTASADVTGTQVTLTAATAPVDSSALCGWTQLFNKPWTPISGDGTFRVILWEFTCDGGVHCEVVDQTFHGFLTHPQFGVDLQLQTNNGNSPVAHIFPIAVNDTLNTNTVGGASSAGCAAHLVTS